MKPCKLCGTKTNIVFNIDFKAVPICEGCANTVFLQQAKDLATKPHQTKTQLDEIFKMLTDGSKRWNLNKVRLHEWGGCYFNRGKKLYVVYITDNGIALYCDTDDQLLYCDMVSISILEKKMNLTF